jgi:hypothetical protein
MRGASCAPPSTGRDHGLDQAQKSAFGARWPASAMSTRDGRHTHALIRSDAGRAAGAAAAGPAAGARSTDRKECLLAPPAYPSGGAARTDSSLPAQITSESPSVLLLHVWCRFPRAVPHSSAWQTVVDHFARRGLRRLRTSALLSVCLRDGDPSSDPGRSSQQSLRHPKHGAWRRCAFAKMRFITVQTT